MMRSIVLFALVLQSVLASCPPNFEFVSEYECRGNYTRVNTYWDEALDVAVAECNEISGVPIIIHNDVDQKYWSSRVAPAQWTPMGLGCDTVTNNWVWVDGSPLDYLPPIGFYNQIFLTKCAPNAMVGLRSDGYWTYGVGHSVLTVDIFCSSSPNQTLPTLPPLPVGCGDFQEYSDGSCYQVYSVANWEEAQVACGSAGATVASVHNAQENSFIRRLAVSNGETYGLYLGAMLPGGKGVANRWIDGSFWDYDNFYPGYPSSGMGDCLALDTRDTAGEWANVQCSSRMSVACMRPQNFTVQSCSSGPWSEGQVIFSPGYPYDASTACDFLLSVDAGKRVEVEVLQLDAGAYDDLVVYENYSGTVVYTIANLTGTVSNETYTTTSSNLATVSWQPSAGTTAKGMMVTFRGV